MHRSSSKSSSNKSLSKWIRLGLLASLALVVVIGLARWQLSPSLNPESSSESLPLLEPLPQDPTIQVYFNYSQAASYTDPYRQQLRLGDDLEQVLVEAIAAAQSTVDVAIQELRLPGVAQALVERQRAGVQVRVVLENSYSRPWSDLSSAEVQALDSRDRGKYQEFLALADLDSDGRVSETEALERDALAMIQAAQIPWIDDTADGSKGSSLMHHKFVVVDRQVVVSGSANFTTSGTHGDSFNPDSRGNVNHLVAIASPDLARLYTEEFDLMWGDGPGGQPDSRFGLQKPLRSPQTVTVGSSQVTVQFSPTSSSQDWSRSVNGLIGRTLSTAQRSIDMALFVFSDQNLSNLLESQHRQGVQIRALIDPGFMYRDYSEGLDLLGLALPNQQCRYGEGNRPWASPITTVGIPILADGDVLHHKFGLVDDRIVVTGSQNWSLTANESNDENLLVIDNPTVAAHFQREFEQLYAEATLGIPDWLQQRVQEQAARCEG